MRDVQLLVKAVVVPWKVHPNLEFIPMRLSFSLNLVTSPVCTVYIWSDPMSTLMPPVVKIVGCITSSAISFLDFLKVATKDDNVQVA